MECADLVKFCCQAAFGIDHCNEKVREQFDADFAEVKADSKRKLIRVTSPDTARVDMAAWKAAGLPPEWLFRMSVVESAFPDSESKMLEYLAAAEKLIPASSVRFSAAEFRKFADAYVKNGHRHLPHSQAYCRSNPAYRVISTRYFHTIPVLKAAAGLLKNGSNAAVPKIIVIDGRSSSGKTTLTGQLKVILDAQTIHMDHFFLPPPMRTKMRYEEPGGNVHYERFKEEVLPNLRKKAAFSYRIFDCKRNAFYNCRMIWDTRWLIVEGAYSMHPQFGNYADLKIFYDIDKEEQMRRIYERNGAKAAKVFETKWIPLEEKYIRTFNIDRRADLILN